MELPDDAAAIAFGNGIIRDLTRGTAKPYVDWTMEIGQASALSAVSRSSRVLVRVEFNRRRGHNSLRCRTVKGPEIRYPEGLSVHRAGWLVRDALSDKHRPGGGCHASATCPLMRWKAEMHSLGIRSDLRPSPLRR
jgi:hypothetical protein